MDPVLAVMKPVRELVKVLVVSSQAEGGCRYLRVKVEVVNHSMVDDESKMLDKMNWMYLSIVD